MITRFANLTSQFTVALLFLLGVVACGGGGGGGGFIPDAEDTSTPLTISTTDLPAASAGTDYTALVEATGGDGPYTWAIIDDGGTGFSINNEGFLTGMAPERGDYGLTLEVTDSANATAKFSVILNVVIGPDSLAITTTALPNGIDGIQYTTLVLATGGKEPYTWAVVDDGGTGLTINNEGVLTGTAPESGDYGLTLQVTDSVDITEKTSFIFTVTGDDTPQPLSISTSSLPNAEELKGYTAVLEAAGGQGDYQWTLVSSGGSGLQLRDDGVLSGTAPAEGQYPITVSVMDDTSTVTNNLLLTVNAESSPLTIITSSLPDAIAEDSYATVLNAQGGDTPYVWTLVDDGGSGLELSPEGILTGSPALAGNFGLIFKVSDGTSTDQLALTLTVTPAGGETEVLVITTETLPDANRVLYAAAVEATGGIKPYTWFGDDTNEAPEPITGFVMDPISGSLTGNTNDLLPGLYGYIITVTDSVGATDIRSYVITVPGGDLPPVRIITEGLDDATESLTYAQVMRAVGGGADKIWTVLETLKQDGTVFLGGPTFDPPGGSADSGVLYWGAADIVAGSYLVTIQVTSNDADSSADVVTFVLIANP